MAVVIFGGFEMSTPIIMNGGGTCKSLKHVQEFAETDADAIVYGSVPYQPRPGNDGTVFYKSYLLTQNSIGMTSEGGEHHRNILPEMVTIAHNAGKLFIYNVAGDTPEEYAAGTEIGWEAGVDIIEQNWSCANKWTGAVQGLMPAYDLALGEEILDRTGEHVGNARLLLKFGWLDPFSIKYFAETLIIPNESVVGVTAINTIANSLSYDDFGHPRITPGGGLSGLAGSKILEIALGQVHQWRQALPPHKAVVGVGGISIEKDVVDYIDHAGATAVQITSAFFGHSLQERNYDIFSTLKHGYLKRHQE